MTIGDVERIRPASYYRKNSKIVQRHYQLHKNFEGGKEMIVVCVDDHSVILKGTKRSVKQILPNASIASFTNADEALDFVKENGCDILICEIELCGLNGLALARSVKNLNPQVNIIFLTVCDEKEYAKEVFGIKPSGYLLKPAKKEQLAAELNHLRYAVCAV
jgi:YesN/AraC family two-component response regulator